VSKPLRSRKQRTAASRLAIPRKRSNMPSRATSTRAFCQRTRISPSPSGCLPRTRRRCSTRWPLPCRRPRNRGSKLRETSGWSSRRDDPEFGGPKLEESLRLANKAYDALASENLKELLKESGLANHPEMVRLFRKAGEMISTDHFVGGKQATRQSPTGPRDFDADRGVLLLHEVGNPKAPEKPCGSSWSKQSYAGRLGQACSPRWQHR
jgi:hypothetical protein